MSQTLSPASTFHIKDEVQKLQTVFTSPNYNAYILVTGQTANGGNFEYQFCIDASNPEFKQFLNDWGARRSAQLL